MCGRMTLTRPDWEQLLDELTQDLAHDGVGPISADEGAAALYRPRYNVAPAQPHPVLRSRVGTRGWASPSGDCWRAGAANHPQSTHAPRPHRSNRPFRKRS